MMRAKTTTKRMLYVHVVSIGAIFRQISYGNVSYAQNFLPVQFFPRYYYNNLCFQLPQDITWIDKTRVISTSTGINWVDVIFIVFFKTVLGREHSGKV